MAQGYQESKPADVVMLDKCYVTYAEQPADVGMTGIVIRNLY